MSLKNLRLNSLLKLIFFMAVISTSACVKENGSCFDEQLYQRHKNDKCPTDCPGVVGCDGEAYCNECEANSHGIRVR